jgi:7-cyano-7-deazaguanine synthase
VVLLSGGLDSTTTLAIALDDGFAPYALTVAYGQRHEIELAAARRVAQAFPVVEHRVIELDLRLFGGSALTADLPVPKDRGPDEIGGGIPVTYVPARNTVFLALALAWAEVVGACDLFIGVSALDYSGYPDCRPAFVQAFEELANHATRQGAEGKRFRVHAPLMDLDKAGTIRRGLELGVDYGLTWTCYDPQESPEGPRACGRCDACRLRQAGFAALGQHDPIAYTQGLGEQGAMDA